MHQGSPATTFTDDQLFSAAARFCAGLYQALGPKREAYDIRPLTGPGVTTADRAQHAMAECARIDSEDRAAFFAECRAKLDASLARIAASDDITRYSIAAE